VQKARYAAEEIFGIIDDKSQLDIRERKGDTVDEVKAGRIQFKKVNFRYPSRP